MTRTTPEQETVSRPSRGSRRETVVWRARLRVVPSEGRCSVCGEAVTASRSYCASCLVPHHDGCWDYNGKCGIYGCSCTTRVDARALAADPFSFACLGKAFGWAWLVLAAAWVGSFLM